MSGGCGCRGGCIGRSVVNIHQVVGILKGVICELFTEEYVGWGEWGCMDV